MKYILTRRCTWFDNSPVPDGIRQGYPWQSCKFVGWVRRSRNPTTGDVRHSVCWVSRCASCSSRSCLANPTYERNHRVMTHCQQPLARSPTRKAYPPSGARGRTASISRAKHERGVNHRRTDVKLPIPSKQKTAYEKALEPLPPRRIQLPPACRHAACRLRTAEKDRAAQNRHGRSSRRKSSTPYLTHRYRYRRAFQRHARSSQSAV